MAGPAAARLAAAFAMVEDTPATHGLFTVDDIELGGQCLDSSATVIHFSRHSMLTDRDPSTGSVQQADRFVRELARR
jgi:hypothetical protein